MCGARISQVVYSRPKTACLCRYQNPAFYKSIDNVIYDIRAFKNNGRTIKIQYTL